MLLDTAIKLIGPEIQNKDNHCLDKCVITYEYPAHILATFSTFFYKALTINMIESHTNTINIYSVCNAEQFHSLNILLNGSYTLNNVTDYFIECIDLLLYIDNKSVANIVLGLFTMSIRDRVCKDIDFFKALRAIFGLMSFELISENNDDVLNYIMILLSNLSISDKKKILVYIPTSVKLMLCHKFIDLATPCVTDLIY